MKKLFFIPFCFIIAVLMAFMPANDRFTPAEQQQISIETPNLFSRSSAFNIDLHGIAANEYSFPLPIAKASLLKNNSIELLTKPGDAIKAVFNGYVRVSKKMGERGYVVVIRHNNGLETVYENNAQNLVKVGQEVKAGQTIAFVGTTNDKGICVFSIMINGGKILPELVVELKSHKLRKQTLLCKKNGNFVDVTVVNNKEKANEPEKPYFYDKNGDLIWKLSALKSDAWAYPLPNSHVISPYGGKRTHSGVDIKTKPNDNIVAAFDGVVTRSQPHFGYGNCIVIKHFESFETLYSHQSKNFVKVGDVVKAGQVIGLTGRTGHATTEHLHFEVMWKGHHFNPNLVFNTTNRTLNNGSIHFSKNGRITSE